MYMVDNNIDIGIFILIRIIVHIYLHQHICRINPEIEITASKDVCEF